MIFLHTQTVVLHWELLPLLQLLAVAIAYLLAVGPLRQRFSGSTAVGRRQPTLFMLGLLSCALAAVTPLDALSHYLFSAHMLQHLLLTLVAPPLLLLGLPAWLARPLLRWPTLAGLGWRLTRPLPAFLAFNVVFLGWHAPGLYQAALVNHNIHIVEHLLFLFSAILGWWPIVGPLPELARASYPMQVLYLFLQSLPPTILGAIIALADVLIYPYYGQLPRILIADPLFDQLLAGLIMWIPGALVFLGALTVVWFIWMQNAEETELIVYRETVEGRR